jgi:hypothetical protein
MKTSSRFILSTALVCLFSAGAVNAATVTGTAGYDVAVIKALKRPVTGIGGGAHTVTTPDGTDTLASDVEAVRFIDGTVLLAPLSGPLLTSDGFLILPQWVSNPANPVRIEIGNDPGGNIIGLIVTSSDGRITSPPVPPRLAGLDVSNVSGPIRITGVTFTPASDLPADGTDASSNIGRLVYNDASSVVSVNESAVDAFKALFVTFDPLYVEGIPPEAKYYANLQFVKLGARYANWLEAGHAPALDFIVKTKGNRAQTLHDNLLGNIQETAIASRVSKMEFPLAPSQVPYTYQSLFDQLLRNTPASRYVDRPYYSGSASAPATATATARWDVANGIARPDSTTFANGSIVLAGDADGDGSFDTITLHPTVADAINAASDGYTILLATGTYTEAITLTKPLTIRAIAGADVLLLPASTARAVMVQAATGDTDGLGGGHVTLANLRIEGGSSGVYVRTGARAGVLTLDHVSISRASQFGLFLEGDGTGVAGGNGATSLVVRDSAFAGNGFQTTPSSNAKLYGFTGDATFVNVVVTGEGSGNSRSDYGIDLVGVPNVSLAHIIPTTPLGNVRFTNVTIAGPFKKNAAALYNYGDLNRLTIDSLDLSGAVAGWGYVLNFDGITASYDASAFDLTLPTGTRVQASLQGDKSGQTPTPQQIVGTASNDLIQGKDASDVVEGGVGNDLLNGGASEDLLRGGPGDDALFGGDDTSTDLLYGEGGHDEAVLTGSAADYFIDYVPAAASTAQPCSNGPSTAAKIVRLADGSFDCAWSIERVVFVNDVPTYLLAGTGVNGTAAVGSIVIGTQNQAFGSMQAAVSAASPGAVIAVNAPADLSGEGLIVIAQDNLTVQAPAGTVVAGFVLGSGVTSFRLAGNFNAKVTGNDAANRIYGNTGANAIDGRGGDDVIVGGGGNDRLSGGNGNDLIVTTGNGATLGGAGDDRIVVAAGNTSVLGGSGNDSFIVGAINQNASLQVQAVVADFVRGADKVNVGDLQKDGAALKLPDMLTSAFSTETPLSLNGLTIDGGTGTVSGSLTLYLLDDPALSNGDFTFVDALETWRTDAGFTP